MLKLIFLAFNDRDFTFEESQKSILDKLGIKLTNNPVTCNIKVAIFIGQ